MNVRKEVNGEGARLCYKPFLSEQKKFGWEVYLVYEDGDEAPVLVTGTAKPKIIKSADALINYHLDYFPQSEGVFVPYPGTMHGAA